MAVDTFSFQPVAPVQGSMPTGRQGSSLAITGPGPASITASAPGGDFGADLRGLAALQKIGNQLIAPHVERFKTQRAMDGAIAVLQGRSAKEVQSEEMFQGMFGDSVAVASARQVEHLNAVNSLNNSIMEGMPEIRKMSPDEYRAYLPSELDRIKTGDPGTDAIITQGFLERLPGLVDNHTKAHIKYRQEVAHQAWSDHSYTAATSFKDSAHAALRGELSSDYLLGTKQAFVQSLGGPEGISAEAYPSWVSGLYRRLVSDGNFQAANVVEETGLLDAIGLTDQQIEGLQKARATSESRFRSRDPNYVGLFGDLGVLMSDLADGITVYETAEDLNAAIQSANELHMLQTGAQEPPINATQHQSIMRAWADGRKKLANDPPEKWSLEYGTSQSVRAYMTNTIGSHSDLIARNTKGGQAANANALRMILSENSDEYGVLNSNAIEVLTRNHIDFVADPVVSDQIKTSVSALRNGSLNSTAGATIANAKSLLSEGARGYAVLQKMVGQDDAEFLSRALYETTGAPDQLVAWATARKDPTPGLQRYAFNSLAPEAQEAVSSWASKKTAGALMGSIRGMFGTTNVRNVSDEVVEEMRPGLEAALANELGFISSTSPTIPLANALVRAEAALQDRAEFIAGQVVITPHGKRRFFEHVGTGDPLGKHYGNAVDTVIREKFSLVQGKEKGQGWWGPTTRVLSATPVEDELLVEVHEPNPKSGQASLVYLRLTAAEVREAMRKNIALGSKEELNRPDYDEMIRQLTP